MNKPDCEAILRIASSIAFKIEETGDTVKQSKYSTSAWMLYPSNHHQYEEHRHHF